MKNIVLRLERPSDYRAVEKLTYEAFKNAKHSDGDEALLVHKLRGAPSFVSELDFVAIVKDGEKVVGNIVYARSKVVEPDDREWETLTFGPVSILPEYQRQGIGSALIRHTLQLAREMSFRAVIIFGHKNYYPRFGFKEASVFRITTAGGENFPAFMALPLHEGALDGVHGKLICDPLYYSLEKEESEAFNAKL